MQKEEKDFLKIVIFSDFFHYAENINMKKNFIITLPLIFVFICLTSCVSVPQNKKAVKLSTRIMDTGRLNARQLTAFFLSRNQDADPQYIQKFAQYYIEEAAAEGVNSDVAFAQMCLETGYLRFGSLVQPEFHNYCGLGAMDAEHPGEQFPDEQTGVRAHIQHLQAYATKEETQLNGELVDPRYNWVHKTKYVEDIYGLAGTWATDPLYGQKLETVLNNMGYY